MLTPSKRRGEELLDDPAVDGGLALRSLRDVALANLFFGGRLVVLRAFGPLFEEWSRAPQSTPRTLLDLGTGLGDIPQRLYALPIVVVLRCGPLASSAHRCWPARRGAVPRGPGG